MKAPPWSFSSLTKYETCGWQYYLTKVAKTVADPPTEHTEWGNRVHKALELRVTEKAPLPEGMQQWEPLVGMFDKFHGRVFAECRYSLNHRLAPTAWAADDCWHRGIIDLGLDAGDTSVLIDWKTGARKTVVDQLKLSAVAKMAASPEITNVRTAFVWLKEGKITRTDYSREDAPFIWREFISRSRRLENAYETDKWPKRPSGLCNGWCPAKGHCEHWRPKR